MLKRIFTLICCLLLAFPACGEEAPANPINTPGREKCGKPNCYWETPMDYTDEETIWAMLTAPITVVDGNFRTQEYVYQEPSRDSARIAEVTCATQSVHVLENRDDGWTKIETYSSSFSSSRIKAWNALVTGYIQTSLLKEVEVRTEYALIVEQLTQRLYIYHEGKLLDELLASTGLGTEDGPYNETRSGEYMLYSPTGAFPSGRLLCNYGIRYNDGDLLHEVPHIPRDNGSKDYSTTEPLLGERASHGCLRIQRKRTEKGINMRWLWEELRDKMRTKIVIWEDWPGRMIPTPDADTQLYYNPDGGKDYHDSPTCYGVLDAYEPLTAFPYGELETGDYARLKPCAYCAPPRRAEEILLINIEHALMPE